MKKDDARFMLRLPADTKEAIVMEAKANNRSMNAEIVYRLNASLSKEPVNGASSLTREDVLTGIIGQLQGLVFEEQCHSRS
jgi:hypothetical protein